MKLPTLGLTLLFCVACAGDRSRRRGSAEHPSVDAQLSRPRLSCGIDSTSHLNDQGIGALTLGTSVADLHARCGVLSDTTALDEEAMPERELRVDLLRDTVTVQVDSAKVYRVDVERPAFQTVDSLGVGTPLRRFTRYPGLRGVEGEGSLFIQVPTHCGISFRLDYEVGEAQHRQSWSERDLQRLPATASVDLVLIIGCGETAAVRDRVP